ncbi:MAG: SUMF1/EgtB/PvdO family nonheme iron enzyme [Treponema sp.]|nr:SUMF1/EgtB/PvdO family nonheme iron enzyme [Treponema sp.]
MAKGFIQALIKWGTGKSKDKYTSINSSDISGEYWTRGGGNFTFYSAMCYCNILSEMCGLEPVYYTNSACTAVFRNGNDRTYYEDKTKNGYRIPTKYEWEWAATSCGNKTVTEGYNYCGFIPIGTPPKTAIYYWNRRFDDRVDYVWDNERQTYIDYGLMGMSGNMWEWTSSKNADGTYIMKGGAYTSEKDKLTYYWDGSSDYATNKNNSWGLRMVRNAEW